ncbi:MAG: patatin-like phospholipase family protein, partial [Betaproteobacteria bacterium]|nr:patatin-like phospholipase family protein [Betaproteobacteria bacterium]
MNTSHTSIARHYALAIATVVLCLGGCAGGIAEYSGPDAPHFAPYPPDQKPRVALVLGGGGPRGFAHIGVLKVLEENGIEADLVVGASVGAMLGALYAHGVSAKEMERIALELDPTRFIGISSEGFKGNGNAVEQWVYDQTNGRALDMFGRKLAVTAAKRPGNELTIFNRGLTGAAVRASAA